MRASLAVAFVLASVLIAPAQSQPPPPKLGGTSKDVPASNRSVGDSPKPNQPQPISVTVVHPDKSAKELQAEAEDRKQDRDIQASMRDFNGYLVAIGVLQIVGMVFGLLYTARAANAAKVSADAATISAQVATEAVAQGKKILDATVDGLRLDHRAWVVPATARFMTPPVAGQYPQVMIDIHNTGTTPAFGLKISNQITYHLATTTLSDLPWATPPLQSVTMLGPNQHQYADNALIGGNPLSDGNLKDIREGRTRLFVYGKIEYADVFKVTRQTTYCMYWDGTGDFIACPFGNDAD